MRSFRQVVSCLAVAIVALAAASAPAHAGIIDGGFETANLSLGLLPYQGEGDQQTTDGWTASIMPPYWGSRPGATCLTVTSGGASEGSTYVSLSASVDPAGDGVPSEAILETSPSFSASAGDTLSFDYIGSISTSSQQPPEGQTGVGNAQASISAIILDSSGTVILQSVSMPASNGWTTESLTLPAAGNYLLEFAANAWADPGLEADASLDIDNVRLSSVPEPSTLVLLGVAAIGLVGYARQRLVGADRV